MAHEVTEAPSTMGLGGAITSQLRESIEKMDLLTVLQKMVAQTPEDEQSEEIREKLTSVLEQFSTMSDEDKERYTAQIKEGLINKLSMKLQDPNLINLGGLEDAIRDAIMTKLYFVAAAVLIFILILVFFGYKLYKSIKDKENKRQEKKMAKQMKKKK